MVSNNQEAETLLRSAIAQDSTQAEPLLLLGLLLERSLRDSIPELRAQVLPLYNKALALREGDPQISPSDLAFAMELKARLLAQLKEPEQSRRFQEQARAIRQKIIEHIVGPASAVDTVYEAGANGVTSPRILQRKEPDYPEEARLARHTAKVVLSAIIDTSGAPSHVELLQPAGFGLDEKAVEAIQTWRFEPGKRDGQVVAVRIKAEFNFSTL
jgi:TonB family protein